MRSTCARLRDVVGRILPRKRRRRHLEVGNLRTRIYVLCPALDTFLRLRTEKWFSALRERSRKTISACAIERQGW